MAFADTLKKLLLKAGSSVVKAVNAPYEKIGKEARKINASIPQNKPTIERFLTALPQVTKTVANNYNPTGTALGKTVTSYLGNRVVAPAMEVPRGIMELRDVPELIKKKDYVGAGFKAANPVLNAAYTYSNIRNPVGTQIGNTPFVSFDALKSLAKAAKEKKNLKEGVIKGATGENYVGLGDVVTKNKGLAEKINTGEQLAGLAIPAYHGIKGILTKGKPVGEVQEAQSKVEIPYKDRFKTTKDGKKVIGKVLDKISKKTVSHAEIKKTRNYVSSETTRLMGDQQAKEMSAAFANLHNEVNTLAKSGKVTPKITSSIKKLYEHRSNAGRLLDGLKVAYENSGTKDPAMIEYIKKVGAHLGDIDEALKGTKGVDFNNPEQVTAYVRKYIKPNAEDWLTKLRYSSMLSSPSTWETNLESNLQGTGLITPIEKTVLGGIDWMRSTVTGKPRKYFAGEGLEYAKGYFDPQNMKDAAHKFISIIKTGTDPAGDVNKYQIGTLPLTKPGTKMRAVETVMDIPGRILLATDSLFQSLTSKGAEKSLKYRQSKGIDIVSDLMEQAQGEARERLFNNAMTETTGGHATKAIGFLGDKVNSLRGSTNPIIRYLANFSLPFVKIPTNIAKATIQYSPFGIADMLGAADKQAVLARSLLGTGVALATGMLASSDRITAGLPKTEKLKKGWKEANLQPWAVKVGDNWFSYQNMHPAISFNMALAAYFKSNYQEIPKSWGEKVLGVFGMAANKVFSQTYVKNITDLMDVIQGDTTAWSRLASNYPSQLIPFRAFQGWLNRAFDSKTRNTDPEGTGLARQLDGIFKQFENNIAGVSQFLPERTDAYGQGIANPAGNRVWNAMFSAKTTTENKPGMEIFENILKNRNEDIQKKQAIQGITQQGQPQAPIQTTGDPALDLMIKQQAEKDRIKTITDILTRKGDYKDVPQGQAQTQRLLQLEQVQKPEIEAAKINVIKSLGTAQTVDYIRQNPSVDFTSLYKQGALTPAVAQEMERQGYIQNADELMKKMRLTDVYYQRKATRTNQAKLSKKLATLQRQTMKKILSKKAKVYKFRKPKIRKVKKPKTYKLPKPRLL